MKLLQSLAPILKIPSFSMISGRNRAISGAIIVCVALLIVYVYVYHIRSSSVDGFTENGERDGTSGDNAEPVTIMLFYATWCTFCKVAKPIWDDVKQEYDDVLVNGRRVVFKEIDCSDKSAESTEMMDKYDVSGYPTIKMVKDGQVYDFDAKPTKTTIIEFMNTVI